MPYNQNIFLRIIIKSQTNNHCNLEFQESKLKKQDILISNSFEQDLN